MADDASTPTPVSAPVDETLGDADAQALVPANTDNEVAPVKKVRKIIKKKRKPARVQIDPATITSEPPPQTGTIFNIWYNKWSGGDRETGQGSQTKARGRCNIAEDAGYTQADKTAGSYFCLRFARGLCPDGSDCRYLHRLPTVTDIFNPNVDCFQRDKFADYRDDMGGVGTFMRQNRTIYVGRIHVSDDIEEIVARHFAEWGQIERIRVLNSRGVAFITYTNEANAEFAKEAMAHQSLDHDEILNVRWATADPNPMAQKREARRVEEQAAEAIRAALGHEYVAELEGRDSDAKKRRRIEGTFGLEGYEAPDDVWYSKGIENGHHSAGDASGSSRLLEAPPDDDAMRQDQVPQEVAAQPAETADSIFSGSTLAALRNKNRGIKVMESKEAKPKAALVGYGSDDDSD
ncbi:Pre-mRNA-splicing factor CWC2 [Stachybotrys elegans]|uniref:Pre-mRNA-splicing factor CWC2 n=1 Tax=Stachybotrys elegans TaxID=80388 RepID=A0A8K0SXK9_9HYPO|nr:Pre-mRNA-splicing factor CWC2 [Stachybotrys elegans]